MAITKKDKNPVKRFFARLRKKKHKRLLRARSEQNAQGLRTAPKVFAIGFNKSATTSIHKLFESIGVPSFHQGDGKRGKWRPITDINLVNKDLLQAYDCFSDGAPRVGDVEILDELYPGAKYILQVRDYEGWVYSRIAHTERRIERFPEENRQPNTVEDIANWIRQKNRYHAYVLEQFSSRPDDLLIVNFIRDPNAALKICEFTCFPSETNRPDANKNPSRERPAKHKAMVEQCLAELGLPAEELANDLLCPSLLDAGQRGNYPTDTSQI